MEEQTGVVYKKTSRFILVLITLLAVADGVVYCVVANRSSQSTDDANIDGDQIIVSSQIAGQIALLGKEERASVAQNDILVTLDDMSLKNQLRQAITDKDLADQNAALAKLKLDQVTSDLQRATAQLQNKIIPQKQYDSLASEKSYAEIQLKIAEALAELDGGNVATAKSNLQRVVIKSPITGKVAKKWVSNGETVQPGQAIYTLYDLRNMWVSANFTKKQAARIAVGDHAEISVDAFPGTTFTGKVITTGIETVSQSSFTPMDNDSGNFSRLSRRGTVTIAFDDIKLKQTSPLMIILPGMTAKVRVSTGR
jgi:membrane fusion protein (multidrug efflux system)